MHGTVLLSKPFHFQFVLLAWAFSVVAADAQTTQGIISGRLLDSISGRPIAGSVTCWDARSRIAGASLTDESGYYYLPLLSPGFYRIRATADAFQSQELQELELTVAGRLELDFRLRPLNDVWEAGQYRSVFLPGAKTIVTFFGPDVDTSRSGSFEAQKGRRAALESTVSEVIDAGQIENLPLQGRDVYTMLITQPGVTSDSATARGLGLSVNGQRPSASNFLLDGLENNNYLTTGPLTPVAPEAIQEYRISTNNFSAEYGRTSGFLANAITRPGSDGFHGVGYFYLKNDVLNANGIQENRLGQSRTPDKEIQPGYFLGGPILRNRLYFSSAFEQLRSRSFGGPEQLRLPGKSAFDFAASVPDRASNKLLTMFPAAVTPALGFSSLVTLSPPVSVNRSLAIERLDYDPANGKDHVMGRFIGVRFTRPDFLWTPYPDFVSPLRQNTAAGGITYTRTLSPALTNEARASYTNDDLHWDRPHPEIPTLTSGDGTILPGSPLFYAYKNRNTTWELLDNVIWNHGRHLITAGAGVLLRHSSGYLTADRDGEYIFDNVLQFAVARPSAFVISVDRQALPDARVPDFNRDYGYRQYYFFAQDTFKVTSRLTINYGLRYELFGAPSNTGATKDVLVKLGSGASMEQRIESASLVSQQSGKQQLFGTDTTDFAIRAGASYDLFGTGRTVLRGAYGTFYDRPFDNLWQNLRNNRFVLPFLPVPFNPTSAAGFNFLQPVASVLSTYSGNVFPSNFPDLTLVDPGLKNGYAHSYFAGLQHRLAENLTLEVNGVGSYGRRLITTDVINRQSEFNPDLPEIAYRAAQGFSDYNALTAVIRHRSEHGLVQASYTWSHAIDNQSEPLLGDFFNLSRITQLNAGGGAGGRAAFTQQFDPQGDRGNSDFDQRHNLVLFGYWNLPWYLRGWTMGALAAFRSGFPYTVIGPATGDIMNPRMDILDPAHALLSPTMNVPGGKQLLNPAAFGIPDVLGNEGRNAFVRTGLLQPGFFAGPDVPLAPAGRIGRLTLRADAFNVLNHANLGNPDTVFTSPTFGIATYGRQGVSSGFPAQSPLNETPRQVQLLLRIGF